MIRPSNNHITLLFGATTPPYSPDHPHIGVDFAPDENDIILAPESGRITLTPNDPQMGNAVHLWVGNRHHAFCHTSRYLVSDGQLVKEGDKLGVMGYSGYVVPFGPAGTHLHWALAVDNKLIDPLSMVQQESEDKVMKPTADDVTYTFEKGFERAARQDELDTYTTHDWPTLIHAIFESNEFKSRLGGDPKVAAVANAIKELVKE